MQQPAVTVCVQGEVEQWEDKVKSLKEELSQLETQKKGLEAILRKHSGTCKVFKAGLYTIKDYITIDNDHRLLSELGK